MTELSDAVLETVRAQMPDRDRLIAFRELLEGSYPFASISILVGFDKPSQKIYLTDAYFRNGEAIKAKEAILPKGGDVIADSFSIITTTPKELQQGSLSTLFGQEQKEVLYRYLLMKLGG